MIRALLLSLFLAGSAAAADKPADVTTAARVTTSVTIRVDDRRAARETVRARSVEVGGWFSRLGPDEVVCRVPTAQVETFTTWAAGLGDLLDRSFSRDDLGPAIADAEARLAARREVLERYMVVLSQAGPSTVVQVEQEITRLVGEIEAVQGELQVLRDRAAYSEVTVGFRFRERRAPVNDGSSSFDWINTMNVADFLYALQSGQRAGPSGARVVAPEGFAPFEKPSRFQAVSPDDVAFRVRSVKHKPRATLAFWQEALRERMIAAGYKVLTDELISAGGDEGALLELGAANGQLDQTYLIAVFDQGSKLVIVEATGEADRFRKRRDAVLTAVKALGL
jgi:hypothetical protein